MGLTAYAQMNLAEANKREGYDEASAVLGELQKGNEFLDNCPFFPSTHGLHNEQTQASRLGKGAFSKINAPVPVISSGAETVTEPVKLYEGESQVDERLLKGVKDVYAVRDSEDVMNLEGAFQDWVYNVFYGSEGVDPKNFRSLARRRPVLGPYCVGAGGSGGDTTSAWLIEFGKRAFYMVYPPNSGTPGFKNEDRGRHKVPAPTGSGQMWAWLRLYEIWAGIVMRNERSLLRYCNIEVDEYTNSFDYKAFAKLRAKLQNVGRNAVLLVNRDLKGQMDAIAYGDVKNGALTIRDIQNMGPVTFCMGIPVALAECIPSTETAVLSA